MHNLKTRSTFSYFTSGKTRNSNGSFRYHIWNCTHTKNHISIFLVLISCKLQHSPKFFTCIKHYFDLNQHKQKKHTAKILFQFHRLSTYVQHETTKIHYTDKWRGMCHQTAKEPASSNHCCTHSLLTFKFTQLGTRYSFSHLWVSALKAVPFWQINLKSKTCLSWKPGEQ